jgi:hypothetical protein
MSKCERCWLNDSCLYALRVQECRGPAAYGEKPELPSESVPPEVEFVRACVASITRKCQDCDLWDAQIMLCSNNDERRQCVDNEIVAQIWHERQEARK